MSRERGELVEAVRETVAALALDGTDTALVALALAYAAQLDERAFLADVAARAVRQWGDDPDVEPEMQDVLRALRGKLAERDALDRLGARLHAALVELGASPRARAKGEAPRPLPAGPTALSRMRGGA